MSELSMRQYRDAVMNRRCAVTPRAAAATLVRVVLACLAVAASASAAAQATGAPVYRCMEPGGKVLYADFPCKGGAQVDIRPGAPAPDATERLARARDELDRAAARRQASDDAAALQREALALRRQEMDVARYADSGTYPPDASYLSGYGYGYYPPYVAHHRPKARPPVKPEQLPVGRVPAVIRFPR